MESYLNQVLHMNVNFKEATQLYSRLPLFFKGSYSLFQVTSGGVEWLAMKPKTDVRLNQLRRDRSYLEKQQDRNVAVFLESASLYSKDKMVEEGIPFVVCNDTIYLPFLGVLLSQKKRSLRPIQQLSFLSQHLLLLGLYEGYDHVSVTTLAKHLNVSKMAISKCFDEMEYLNLGVVNSGARRRTVSIPKGSQKTWQQLRPFLRNPVIKVFTLKDDIKLPQKAGISALSEYSMLSDNNYPTYAVAKKDLASSGVRTAKQAGRDDDVGCQVFELAYFEDCLKENIQDPLSTVLSIEEEMLDARVEECIDEMLEGYVWLQD